MRLLRAWPVIACLLPAFVLGDDGKPKVTTSKGFEEGPPAIFYFEDSSVILNWDLPNQNVYRSDNDGEEWELVKDFEGNAKYVWLHPFDKKKAIVLGPDKTHWATDDTGKSWEKFTVELPVSDNGAPLAFHNDEDDWVLYTGADCFISPLGPWCDDATYYTKNWFKDTNPLKKQTHGCVFARGTKEFKEAEKETVLCVVDGKDDKYQEHWRILVSDDWFGHEEEPKLDGYRAVAGVTAMASVTKFIVAAVKIRGSDNMQLYVSDDAKKWHRAEFPDDHGGLKEGAYTILESTPYSIQVDVLTTDLARPIGELFTSNSNGTYFTKNIDHTNRVMMGLIDFEQVKNIDGIVLANIVRNAEEVAKSFKTEKQLVSKISFDDGKADTWQGLKVKDSDEPLHLHSVTQLTNGGRVFSSDAPGILMGIGNEGGYLKDYVDGDLYVSYDAGLTWFMSKPNAHKYEIGGSGSILVAVYDEGPTNKVIYSTNFGGDWNDLDLGMEIRAKYLTTTPDSTSMKFILVGASKKERKHFFFALDFTKTLPKCKKEDFTDWIARRDEKGEADCLMGHKQSFSRRKKDAQCYVDDLFNEQKPEEDSCACQDHDFECDFNFIRSKDGCVIPKDAKLAIPPGECKNPDDMFMGPSGYRKIPGNTCSGGVQDEKEKDVERKCGEVSAAPNTGDIQHESHSFSGSLVDHFYLQNTEESDPDKRKEVVIMRTDSQKIHISRNHGKTWDEIEDLKDVKVTDIYPHLYDYETVYFTTPSKDVWFTTNSGASFKKIDGPSLPTKDRVPTLDFHPTKSDWLIWTGQRDCDDLSTCRSAAYYTKSRGENDDWHLMTDHSRICKWIRGQKQAAVPDALVFCERIKGDELQLVASTNFFDDELVHFPNIIGFATMEEFIIVAGYNGTSLKASASIDGQTFADAHFPPNVNVPVQTAYTVLDSSSNSVFLHVTVNSKLGSEYGSLLKSNSNGTSYVMSLDAVNRNEFGYVDFEKMHSVEGVAVVNRVVNFKEAANGEQKQLRTEITHNDGGQWAYIKAPEKDSDGHEYGCKINDIEVCSLNLHHYTERTDPRHTFASQSAVGLMMGVGNVGDRLTGFADGSTFLTTDAGVTWREVAKGPFLWEYGDQGSIIVIVDRSKPVDHVRYSLDQGEKWLTYSFEKTLLVRDISTVPTDTSRKFLLWGTEVGGGEKFFTVHLDFSGITDQKCVLADDNNGISEEDDDFEDWHPKMPNAQEKCLFGHEVIYRRKIPSRRCYIGRPLPPPKEYDNCPCTRTDYECDYNYERQADGTCQLVPGLEAPDHEAIQCADPDTVEWFEPTGYRRLPKTTCEGGKEFDKTNTPKPCPGKGDRFKKKHGGLGGFGLFLAIVLPIGAAAGVGWYVWTHWLNGSSFGAIRLGDDYGGSNLMQYPIMALSAVVAVVAAIPTILSVVGGWLSSKFTSGRTGRYTTRSSFSRGNYSIVNNDEGELLGSDDEDEV